jgi:septum formation protein
MKRFILASASPTRRRFFSKFPHPFEAIASGYEEDMSLDLAPAQLAISLSQGKARDVAARYKNAVVLGIDTFMVFQGELLGKPHTSKRAKEMLRMLSGQTHTSVSGFTIIDSDTGREVSDTSIATVKFRMLSDDEINAYVASKEPLDKAGAYASQEMGSLFVECVEGDFYSLSGVPVAKIGPRTGRFWDTSIRKGLTFAGFDFVSSKAFLGLDIHYVFAQHGVIFA